MKAWDNAFRFIKILSLRATSYMKKPHVFPHTTWAAKSLWSIEFKSLSVLLCSLTVIGFGEGLLLLSDLGSAPWTVLSQGVATQGEFSVGWASWIISMIVMLAWFPLRLKPGLATVNEYFRDRPSSWG